VAEVGDLPTAGVRVEEDLETVCDDEADHGRLRDSRGGNRRLHGQDVLAHEAEKLGRRQLTTSW
jgi:hypothetical protein